MRDNAYVGKVAVVTGGASGIGAALAKEIARAGGEVVLADRQVDVAEVVANEIRQSGGRATAEEIDVRSLPSITRVVDATVGRSGTVDYFFNNAGISCGGEIDTYEARDWEHVFDVNLRGVTNGIQAVYPLMIARKSGHIVNTASLAGLIASPGAGAYTASKHAVVGLSRALRIEAKRHGVRVSVLCPGAIDTPILAGGKFGHKKIVGLSEERAREMWKGARPMHADAFAKKATRAVAKNTAIIVLPWWWKLIWYVDRASPSLGSSLSEAALENMRAQLARAGLSQPQLSAQGTEKGD